MLTERTTQTIDGQPVSKLTTHVYDADGQLLRTTYPDGSVSRRTYDGNGNVLTETDALERTTTHTYDLQNRKTSTRHPVTSTQPPEIERWTYDAEGRELSHTDVLGSLAGHAQRDRWHASEGQHARAMCRRHHEGWGWTTKKVYDKVGRLIETIHPDATPATDADNPRTRSVHDAAGRLTQSIDELGRTTTYESPACRRRQTRPSDVPKAPRGLDGRPR